MFTTDMFMVNDIVQLKSGGPLMCVITTKMNEGLVCCTWFNVRGEAQRCDFLAGMLTILRPLVPADRKSTNQPTAYHDMDQLLTVDDNGQVWTVATDNGHPFGRCLGRLRDH